MNNSGLLWNWFMGGYNMMSKGKKIQQAGAELCQAQHQLWKMLLEELDLDEEKIFQSG